MTGSALQNHSESTPDCSGVEFGRSAEDFPVARIGGLIFATLPAREGTHSLASTWWISKPLAETVRDDFDSFHGPVEHEVAFRSRMFEQAEHSRELHALDRQTKRISCFTPWGPSQGATIYAEGVVAHMTAGHGGLHLSAARNAKVVPSLRNDGGWYEEDDEWAIVAITFPDLFTTYERKLADKTFRDRWRDEWERMFARQLEPGTSKRKDQRAFEQEHAGDWIVVSALYSDHSPGMTEVIAVVGGKQHDRAEERRFLVPSAEYAARGRFGFVIDEVRHVAYDGPSSFLTWQERKAS